MRYWLLASLLAGGAIPAGCATHSVEDTAEAMLGRPRTDLLACAGPPYRNVSAAGREYLAYRADMGPEKHPVSSWCVMTFTVQDGRVTKWRGEWDGPVNDKGAACQNLMAACTL
ncbi:MAG: hypothetical protein ACREH3_11970 [Geminicoccales bacterium]